MNPHDRTTRQTAGGGTRPAARGVKPRPVVAAVSPPAAWGPPMATGGPPMPSAAFQSKIENQKSKIHPPRGFTLIEMLVVIVIIVLLLAVGIPGLNGLLNSGRAEAGLTAVSAGASAARAYATRDRAFLTDLDPGTTGDQTSDELGDGYSGAAALITPAWEIRLVMNDQVAVDGGNDPLELKTPPLNGYADIEGREYIQIPSGAAVVGIARNGPNPDDVILLSPPFAIRFDRNGSLIAGQNDSRLVHYDGNYDGQYAFTTDRDSPRGSSPQIPAQWDPESPSYLDDGDYEPDNDDDSPDPRDDFSAVPAQLRTEYESKYTGRLKLPFEAIETVIGVIAFDYSEFKNEGYVLEYELDNTYDAWEWILENGEPLFLNRQTGTVMKEQ